MEQNYLIVKKDVVINGSPVLKKGAYVKDEVVSRIPILNYGDGDYFATAKTPVIEPGTRVIYNGKKYYIISLLKSTSTDSFGRVTITPTRMKGDSIDLKYAIASSMTDRPKDHKFVSASELKVSEIYWFINSKGIICTAYRGDDPSADMWRELTQNMWKTQASALDAKWRFKNDVENK